MFDKAKICAIYCVVCSARERERENREEMCVNLVEFSCVESVRDGKPGMGV